MTRSSAHIFWSCLLLVLIAATPVLAQQTAAQPLSQFLKQYCIDCHSGQDPGGERDLSGLFPLAEHPDSLRSLQEVIDQLVLSRMPPQDAEQPDSEVVLQMIQAARSLQTELSERVQHLPSTTVLRRLNRREYRNTVSALLGLPLHAVDPTQTFPDDQVSAGFDNISNSLSTSGFLLQEYLEAADICIEKAWQQSQPVTSESWHFTDKFFQQQELAIAHRNAFDHRFMVLYDHPLNDKPEGAYGPVPGLPQGVPFDGIYTVRILAEALHRDTPYSPRVAQIDCSEPFRLGIRPGDTRIRDQVHIQPVQPLLAETVIADNQQQWYEFNVWLDRGFVPRFTFENGQHDVRNAYARVFREHKDTIPEELRGSRGIVAMRNSVIATGYLPQIRIYEIAISGPLPRAATESEQLLIADVNLVPDQFPQFLSQFLRQAWRRPVNSSDSAPLLQLYEQQRQQGTDDLAAARNTLKAALCSPEFLYFKPPSEAASGTLTAHGLAERLAFFLTSAPPDDALARLADTGEILQPQVLAAQTTRLLQSPASERFVADFADSWLNLRELGNMPPDARSFQLYYSLGLQDDMKQETVLFLQQLIQDNEPATQILTAEHTFVNRDLARLYELTDQIPPEEAATFHRVTLPDTNRRGLLGHASVLTVSANGIETSPVVRGVWVLEKILGFRAPPPPDDVPAIDPDVRGATSIRTQLEQHRENAACAQCHRLIDPPGFALEGFDPIGRSRNFYDAQRRIPIDTAGVLPDSTEFAGIADLRSALAAREDVFVRNITLQLLTYALGRLPGPQDQATITSLLRRHFDEHGDFRLQDLILSITSSTAFRNR